MINKDMKYAIILVLFLLTTFTSWAQIMKDLSHKEINIHFNDSSVKANVLLLEKKEPLNSFVDYYWYHDNSIKHNQGGYKGKLLDGQYQVTLKGGNLITKGNFKNGKKEGVWKRWSEGGKLETSTEWSKGIKKGSYKKYADGLLIEKGGYNLNCLQGNYFIYENSKVVEKKKYQKGQLHGKQITYKADTVFSESYYNKGAELINKEKKKLSFPKLFNKKKSENTDDDAVIEGKKKVFKDTAPENKGMKEKKMKTKDNEVKAKNKLIDKKKPFWKKNKDKEDDKETIEKQNKQQKKSSKKKKDD